MSRCARTVRWAAVGGMVIVVGALAVAGPLDPPAGPVAPTYKTLTEVEPRIPVGPTTTPGDGDSVFRISQPGSYYITGNLTGQSGKAGIEIEASGVTIDLMGFTLQGVPGSLDGIATTAVQGGITIRNGTVTGFGQTGIDLDDGGEGPGGDLIEGVHVLGNSGSGLRTNGSAVVRRCTAVGNGGWGIGVARNAVIESCTARENAGAGIVGSFGCAISGCQTYHNGSGGFSTGAACALTGCAAFQDAGDGIFAGNGSTVTSCTASFSSGSGILAGVGSTVADCAASNCTLDGIRISSRCTARSNTCNANGAAPGDGAGLHATSTDNRLEANTCTGNDRGIDVDGAGNVVIRNTCSGNTSDWEIAANNVVGPILDRRAPASAAISGFSAPDSTGSTHPNANFSY